MTINWKSVWSNYDEWLENLEKPYCPQCGHRDNNDPSWEEQRDKIQQFISIQILKMVTRITINWEELWENFEEWFLINRNKYCSKCNHVEKNIPEWEDQQYKIQKLVDAQMRRKKTNKKITKK